MRYEFVIQNVGINMSVTYNSGKFVRKLTIVYYFLISSFVLGQDYWEPIPSLDIGEINSLAIYKGSIIVGSTAGLFYYSEISDSLLPMAEDIFMGKDVYRLTSAGDRLYVITSNNGVFLYETEWNSIWPEISARDGEIECIVADGDTIIVGSLEKVYYSDNNGESWNYPGDSSKIFENKWIWSLYKSKQGYVYAGTSCGLFGLIDNKSDWIELENFICGDILSFAENSKGDIYIGGADRFQGIYKSSDNGFTWKQVYDPPNNNSIQTRSIIIGPKDEVIFSSYNEGGVFISTENDTTYENINLGLTDLSINSLVVNSQNYLFAGSRSKLFKSLSPITDVEDEIYIPERIKLFQNYPNPFNPTTKIQFSIPFSDHVQIKVFDILGREVKILFDGYKEIGKYELELNANSLPSGIYFYKIFSNGYALTRKMILLR